MVQSIGRHWRAEFYTYAYTYTFLSSLHEGKILQDVTFELLTSTGRGVEKTMCRGAWGLCDNGCHRWACTQAPGKVNGLLSEQRLSDWIESFRKDSECTFGVIKGRWRVSKTGVRLENPVKVDEVWLTCCALHGCLLEADGLAEEWNKGVSSDDFLGMLGDNEPEDVRMHMPFAV